MNNIVQAVELLFLGAVILFGAHFFIYVSVVHFFALTDPLYKHLIASGLVLLSLSFFLSSVAAHFYENTVMRSAYFLSGFWLGLLVNLVLACLSLWLLLWASRYLSFAPDRALLGAFFLGLALLISLYGVWNALHPEIKRITVRIPGLPDVWKGKVIVQLSDVHLGHVYQAGFLEGVVREVNAVHPKIVVITGDLFDGMDGHLDSLVQPFNALQAEKGVFFITGNHETYLGVETALSALKETQVKVMKDEVQDIDGLRLIGISYPKRGEKKDVISTLQSLRDQFSGEPNVLLYHAPTNIREIASVGVNLMLSGHTHQGQQFPFQYVTRLVHQGYDYGLYPLGNFTLYTTSGVGTWGPTMRIGTRSEIVAITLE